MKMMPLDNVALQAAKSASLGMPPGCVCGTGSSESSGQPPAAPVLTCPCCGGSLPQAGAPERQERKHLQDFLSAFV
jgi:hypothetical protein